MGRNKAHQKYTLKDGSVVKGVTTIIDNNLGWNKRILMGWSRKIALAGKDPDKVKQEAADIGTIAHAMIEHYIKKTLFDPSQYPPDYVKRADKCFQGYLEWEKKNKFKNIKSELFLVSETYKYGGTIDKIGESDNGLTMVDFKTSSGIYNEAKIQQAAYNSLALENNYPIDRLILLHLSKNGDFAEHKIVNVDKYWQVFLHCLKLQELKDELG